LTFVAGSLWEELETYQEKAQRGSVLAFRVGLRARFCVQQRLQTSSSMRWREKRIRQRSGKLESDRLVEC